MSADIVTRGAADAAGAAHRGRRRWPISERVAAGWLIVLIVSMLVLPMLLSLDPLELSSKDRLASPSAQHLLGTDNLGRDLLARALDGAQVSLLIGVGSTVIAGVIGVPVGMLSGYLGGRFDAVASFVVDVILAFPGLVLALALTSFLGPSVMNVMIAITVPMFPVFVRLAKAQTRSIMNAEYVEASEVIGTPTLSIMRRDILPNILEALLSFAFVSVGRAILIEGGLSFLGIGVPLPQPTWGSMIDEGRIYMATNPLVILVPALFLILTILSLNIVSDRFLLNDAASQETA